jgi:putative endonuclease
MISSGSRKLFGREGEDVALRFLNRQGYRIETTNFRSSSGEIDIIAWDRGTLVFIEVKSRRNQNYGMPFEAVDHRKQIKIRTTAQHFLGTGKFYCQGYRFDVLSLLKDPVGSWRIDHIKNAF